MYVMAAMIEARCAFFKQGFLKGFGNFASALPPNFAPTVHPEDPHEGTFELGPQGSAALGLRR